MNPNKPWWLSSTSCTCARLGKEGQVTRVGTLGGSARVIQRNYPRVLAAPSHRGNNRRFLCHALRVAERALHVVHQEVARGPLPCSEPRPRVDGADKTVSQGSAGPGDAVSDASGEDCDEPLTVSVPDPGRLPMARPKEADRASRPTRLPAELGFSAARSAPASLWRPLLSSQEALSADAAGLSRFGLRPKDGTRFMALLMRRSCWILAACRRREAVRCDDADGQRLAPQRAGDRLPQITSQNGDGACAGRRARAGAGRHRASSDLCLKSTNALEQLKYRKLASKQAKMKNL
eukprot:scaffold35921_cov101-Isochrysis_galbana.AAC.3